MRDSSFSLILKEISKFGKKLEKIDFTQNELTVKSMNYLEDWIKDPQNCILTIIILDKNNLKDEGILALADALFKRAQNI